MILYKYYSRLDYAHDDIRKKEVYMSSPQDFNDGFEATLYDEDISQYIMIDDLHILCLSPFYLNQNMWGSYANSEKGVCIGYKIPKALLNSVRYSNELITKASIDEVMKEAKVPQSEVLPINTKSIRKKCALLKAEDWLHEEEYRIVLDSSDVELIKKNGKYYVKLEAVKVYIGRKTDQGRDNYQKLMDECKKQSIEVYEIIRGTNRRCLEVGNKIC